MTLVLGWGLNPGPPALEKVFVQNVLIWSNEKTKQFWYPYQNILQTWYKLSTNKWSTL